MATMMDLPQGKRLSSAPLHLLLPALLMVALADCASLGVVTGQDPATLGAMQSETAATTSVASGQHRVVVAFNDMTGNEGKIVLTPNSRFIRRGASLAGWSYSQDLGRTWTYGGKLAPPVGWSILWGDPAITTSRLDPAVVFMSSLAAPDSKFPANGIDGSPGAAMGGACIARSLDGGVTFAHYQCINTNFDFYDGASMAASPCGEIYAAYFDISTAQIRVWRARDHNAPFEEIANPFPGLTVGTHPRLRTSSDSWLYVATEVQATSGQSFVYMNRYRDGQWRTPVQVSETTAGGYPSVNLGTTVLGKPLSIRTGPQFSFDVGAASEGGNDAMRILYTRRDANRLYVEGAACAADLTSCHPVPQWRSSPGSAGDTVDAFNPAVTTWAGTMSRSPVWTSSFYVRNGAAVTGIGLSSMTLGYFNNMPLGIPISLVNDITVCSDLRGYWGDYDDMLHVGFDKDIPVFIRFTSSDHRNGCTYRWEHAAQHQHVQSVRQPK